MISPQRLWETKLPKRVNAVAIAENEEVAAACDDGCIYFIWRDGSVTKKVCGKAPVSCVRYREGKFYALSKDGTVSVFDLNGELEKSVKILRFNECLLPLDDGFVACSDACARFTFEGERLWIYDVGHVGKSLSACEKLYVPDVVWRKVHEVDLESGKGDFLLSFKEKVYSVDCLDELIAVGTTKEVALVKNNEVLWSKDVGAQMTFVKFVNSKTIVVANFGSKVLKVLNVEGKEEGSVDLDDKPTGVDVYAGIVVVGTAGGKVITFKLPIEEERIEKVEEKEEEVKEVEEVAREVSVEEQPKGEKDELEMLKEIAEGAYMGTPIAREILGEMSDIIESTEKAKNISELIESVLKEVDKLTSTSSSDWKQVYANYEEAERLLESVLEVVNELREKIGEVEECPPPDELLAILKEKNPKFFTEKLAKLGKGESVAERVKNGVIVVKKCLEKYFLLPPAEEIEKVQKKLEEVKSEKEAIKALIEAGL